MDNTLNALNELAKERKEDPNRIKAIYALERIVARLEIMPKLSASLVYKGGYVLYKTTNTKRLTRDVDALAHEISPEEAIILTKDALAKNLKDDIFFYDLKIKKLETTGDYGGLRVDVAFAISDSNVKKDKIKKLSRVHFDIGFGEYLPDRKYKDLMSLVLEKPGLEVSWSTLPLEYIFAEKFQTLVLRGSANSRAKDIYDMWFISKEKVSLKKLKIAIARVFNERKTELPNSFYKYVRDLDLTILRSSWRSVTLVETEASFDEIIDDLIQFLKRIS